MQAQVDTFEPQSGKFPQAIIWIAGIALTLFCGVGIAAFMGWIPNSLGSASDKAALERQAASTMPPPALAPAPKAPKAASNRAATMQPAPIARSAPAPVAAAAACAECGVIESVRVVEAKGTGSGLGAVGGAVVGGLLGNQVGAGHGKDAMTVVGAVGGAFAGNEVEKRVKTSKSYEVTVRLNDGSRHVIKETGATAWHTGDKIKLVNGAIQSNA